MTIYDDDDCDDDCCFPAGTMITMADGSQKPIEHVKIGDYVRSFDTINNQITTCKVLETVNPIREGIYIINNDLVKPTDDHPFYTKKSDGAIGWAAINPEHSQDGYKMNVLNQKITLLFAV